MPDASVEVNPGDGSGFVRPVIKDYPGRDARLDRVLTWTPLATAAARKYNVPTSWILAVINAESGGKADAENKCCVGLMAIYAAIHGFTREELKNPEINIDYGTSLLAKSAARGCDLPVVASHHVAGGLKQSGCGTWSGTCCSALCRPDCDPKKCVTHPGFPGGSPWGMCEHMFPKTWGDGAVGYIDRVVRGNNTFLDLLGQARWQPPELPGPPEVTLASLGSTLAPFAAGGILAYLSIDYLRSWLRKHA